MSKSMRYTKKLIIFFMVMLVLSGLTAIPLEAELELACRFFPTGSLVGNWLDKVYMGVQEMNSRYPYMAYGYDWLAYAHFVLALLFIGPLKDPVRNKWVIEFGLIACALIIPFALVAGHFRDIPFWWRLVDCSFGLIGFIPLTLCLREINYLESSTTNIE